MSIQSFLKKLVGKKEPEQVPDEEENFAEITFLFECVKSAGIRTADASPTIKALQEFTDRELLGLFASSPEYANALLKVIAYFLPLSTGSLGGLRPEVAARIENSPEYAQSVIEYAAARKLTNVADITTGGVDEAMIVTSPLREGAL